MNASAAAPSREQLLYTLHEAAEIEHNLMCCYFYAGFSLKRTDARWSAEQAQAVARWRDAIVGVAMEEMTHLALVANLVHAIGGQPHFGRPMFPIGTGPYPAGFVIRLQPFSAETMAHFQFLERPVGAVLGDGAGYEPLAAYRRGMHAGRLSPGAQDYDTVGELYASVQRGLRAFCEQHGEAALFIGEAALQVDGALVSLDGMRAVTDLDSALAALQTIVVQGEGAGEEQVESHFCRFTRVADELAALTRADAAFEPAWPAATNPVMNPPPMPEGKVHVDHPLQAQWLDVGNAMYSTSLRCLLQGFAATEPADKARWLGASFALMRALMPVGQGLAARPARDGAAVPHAGLTFTILRTLSVLPPSSAAEVIGRRLFELRDRAAALPMKLVAGESAATWQRVIDALDGNARLVLGAAAAAVPVLPSAPAAAPTPAAPAPAPAAAVERVSGRELDIGFDSQRCIHARHCVLQAPSVFKANTPGAWIFPDTMRAAALVAVAEQCPSGAITYRRRDGQPDEAAPPVNLLRVRENGPYAVHAPLVVAGRDDGFRATLCRCGASHNKPYCDGSHAHANDGHGFAASGEPATETSEALAARDGALQVTPLRNGPLQVRGNLEITSGTGRTIAKIGLPNADEARLCRCGHSRRKPFCDGSHVGAGFVADGA
jgi:CDGSH-type Zn-finger protein/uncharacterized Fe-S cluster protein YjdI